MLLYSTIGNNPKKALTKQDKAANLRSMNQSRASSMNFRLSYIALPLIFFAITLLLLAIYYNQLGENIAFRFDIDGQPSSYLDKGTLSLWLLAIQFSLTVFAYFIVRLIIRSQFLNVSRENVWINTDRLILIIGNMVALPQLVFTYAAFDAFYFNTTQAHLLSLWLFTVIVVMMSAITFSILIIPGLVKAFRVIFKQH
jgi:uncharacterized membrane protein